MAQTRKTFFDLGAAERIADPREEEAARRRALEIEEMRRQDALRAAIQGEGLQRQQLAQSQQQSMAKLGFDREKFGQEMGLDRDRMAAAQAEAEAGRAHGLTLREMIEGGMGTRQEALFGQQTALQGGLMRHQSGEGLARDASAMGRLKITDATQRKLSGDALQQTLRLSNNESQRRDQRANREERTRVAEREADLHERTMARDAMKEDQRAERGRRRSEAQEREKTTRARDKNTAEYRDSMLGVKKDEKIERADAGKAAASSAGRERLEEHLKGMDLSDEATPQRLKDLAALDPNVRAALDDPAVIGWLTGKLRRAQWKDADSAGGAFRRQLRVEGNRLLPEGWVDRQHTANEKQMDRLRDALRLR